MRDTHLLVVSQGCVTRDISRVKGATRRRRGEQTLAGKYQRLPDSLGSQYSHDSNAFMAPQYCEYCTVSQSKVHVLLYIYFLYIYFLAKKTNYKSSYMIPSFFTIISIYIRLTVLRYFICCSYSFKEHHHSIFYILFALRV